MNHYLRIPFWLPASLVKLKDACAAWMAIIAGFFSALSRPTQLQGLPNILAEADQRSDSEPNDTTSIPIEVGPTG
jgi:hypothetical protein